MKANLLYYAIWLIVELTKRYLIKKIPDDKATEKLSDLAELLYRLFCVIEQKTHEKQVLNFQDNDKQS